MATSRLEVGRGRYLWKYWTRGEGLSRWAAAEHPYDTLRVELAKEDVPAHEIDGEAANIFLRVFHETPYQHAHGHASSGHALHAANVRKVASR
jgi:hypothetical protein